MYALVTATFELNFSSNITQTTMTAITQWSQSFIADSLSVIAPGEELRVQVQVLNATTTGSATATSAGVGAGAEQSFARREVIVHIDDVPEALADSVVSAVSTMAANGTLATHLTSQYSILSGGASLQITAVLIGQPVVALPAPNDDDFANTNDDDDDDNSTSNNDDDDDDDDDDTADTESGSSTSLSAGASVGIAFGVVVGLVCVAGVVMYMRSSRHTDPSLVPQSNRYSTVYPNQAFVPEPIKQHDVLYVEPDTSAA